MKKVISILLCVICCSRLMAQSVPTIEAKIDTQQILIGEQAKLQLEVTVDAKQRVVFPTFSDTIITGIEVIDAAKPDTQSINDNKRLIITQEYTITSFDSALYYIPSIPVMVDKKQYDSNAIALKVLSIPVDTLQADQFYGIKNIMKAPFAWEDWYGSITCSLLAIPLALLLVYLIVRINDNKPIMRKIKIKPQLPAHSVALNKIEHIKGEKDWQKGHLKKYYTDLTDALRTYIAERFGFNALEMTSAEIIDKLLEVKDKRAIEELKGLLETSDLVKFAKYTPLMNENDANLIKAISFINETKLEEDVLAKRPTEITIVEKRSLKVKILIILGIILSSLLLIAIIIYVIAQLYSFYA